MGTDKTVYQLHSVLTCPLLRLTHQAVTQTWERQPASSLHAQAASKLAVKTRALPP